MILVFKKVYKVLDFWKYLMESVGVCFESVWCVFVLKMSKQLRTSLPTQNSFVHFFLPLILLSHHWLVRSLIFGCKGMGMGHRIVMIEMLWDILVIIFEGLRSFWKETFDSVIEGLWSCIFYCFLLRYPTCITWPFL